MTDFITLACTSCGGKLEITRDIERFACSHCGTEHLVKRGVGVISLAPVVESITKIQEGTSKTASELAIIRIKNEIAEVKDQIEVLMNTKISIAPVYRFFRYRFQKLGKLNFWNVGFATNKKLEKIMRSLTIEELDELLTYTKEYVPKQGIEWLQNYRKLFYRLIELQKQLAEHINIVTP